MGFSILHPALLAAGLLAPVAAILVWWRMPPPLSRRRSILTLVLRLLILLMVVGAIAGLSLDRTPRNQAVIAVVDRSASVNATGDQERQAIKDLQSHLGRGDRLGVVTTGQQAEVEQPPSAPSQGGISFSGFTTVPNPNYTDLEAGLRLAGSIEPTDARHHVVVLSDGRQNLGDALAAVRLLRSQGTRVDVLPVTVPTGAEARVDGIQAPTTLPGGASTTIQVQLSSNTAEPAALTVFLDGAVIERSPVSLPVGQTQVGVPIPAPPAGFHTLKAQLDPTQDTYAENNVDEALIQVLGQPKVLVVEGSPGGGATVAAALTAAALHPQVVAPAAVPDAAADLAAYSAVALVDVPAASLSLAQMQALESGVRDLGIGLAAFGGEDSLGPGGYAGTPLDTTLPVTAQIPQQLRKPPLAVVLVLETMESPQADVVMRGAAKAVVDQLSPQDMVGVADGASGMVVPLTPASDKAKIDQVIANASFGDSPSYAPFVNDAATALHSQPNANKYIIVVGDGDAQDDDAGLGHALAAEGINVSAIGINVHGQPQFMTTLRTLTQAGGGSFYESDDPSQLPQLLLQDTQKTLKPWIVQGTFTPQLVTSSPALGGVDAASIPAIDGYVASTPKPAAEMVLASPSNDPVLATWQFGLGRALAWTSDAAGLWTKTLIGSPLGGTLLANEVAWTLPPAQDPALALQATLAGDQGHVTAHLANPPAGASVVASVAGPEGQGVTVPLSTTAPGRFEGDFPASATGSYVVRVTVTENGRVTHTALGGLAVAYSPEYRFLGTDQTFLGDLARAGGGVVLSSAGAAFAQPLAPIRVRQSLAFLLLAIAVLALPFDIAARRLVLSRGDAAAWTEAMQRRESRKPAAVEPTLERLRGRLERHRLGAGTGSGGSSPPGEAAESGPPPSPHTAPEADEDLAARLLAKRRKQD